MAAIKRLNITTTQQTLSPGKPFSANLFNDFSETASTDFASLSQQWNNSLVPLLRLSPTGDVDTLVDAFKDGLDGRTFYVDASADMTPNKIRYFNINKQRPKTLKEMLDEILGPVNIAYTQGIKGDTGDAGTDGTNGVDGTDGAPGVGGGGGGETMTWTAFPAPGSPIVNTHAVSPTTDAVFYVDLDKFGSTVDVYLSCVGKIAPATYAGGVAAWVSDFATDNPGPDPFSTMDDTLFALVEFDVTGTFGNYIGGDDIVLNLPNPGGKKYILITSFAGATTPESDTGAKTLNYYGLTLQIKDHVA